MKRPLKKDYIVDNPQITYTKVDLYCRELEKYVDFIEEKNKTDLILNKTDNKTLDQVLYEHIKYMLGEEEEDKEVVEFYVDMFKSIFNDFSAPKNNQV